MRKVPGYPLWLGHAGDGRDARAIFDAGIVAVVDLAAEEPPAGLPRGLVYCRFPLTDGPGNPAWLLAAAVDCVANFVAAGVPTLVACSAGMSRTPAVAAAALARFRSGSLADGLTLVVAAGPADVSPGLLADVAGLSAADRRHSGLP